MSLSQVLGFSNFTNQSSLYGFVGSLRPNVGNVAACAMGDLIKPLYMYKEKLMNSNLSYDKLVSGLSSSQALFSSYRSEFTDSPEVGDLVDEHPGQTSQVDGWNGIFIGNAFEHPNDMPADVALIYKAFYEAVATQSGKATITWEDVLNITSSSGLTYQIQIHPLPDWNDNTDPEDWWASVNKNVIMMLTPRGYTPLLYISRDSVENYCLLCSNMFSRFVTDTYESTLTILSNIISSSTLNGLICDTIDSITTSTSGGLSSFIASTRDKVISGSTSGLNKLSVAGSVTAGYFQRLSAAFSSGGFKGVINFLYSLARSPQNMSDQDGLLQFTDNASYAPKEYITGMISGIVSTLLDVITLILAAFGKVITAILALLSTVAKGIFASFTADRSETKVQVVYFDQEDKQALLIPYLPIATFQGENQVLDGEFPLVYEECLKTGHLACYIDMGYGAILMGPGSFDNNQNVTSLRYEFHPSGVIPQASRLATVLSGLILPPESYTEGGDTIFIHGIDAGVLNQLSTDPTNIRQTILSSVIDSGYVNPIATLDGALSDNEDKQLYTAACCWTALFMLEIIVYDMDFQDWIMSDFGEYVPAILTKSSLNVPNTNLFDICFGVLCHVLYNGSYASSAKWTELIAACSTGTLLNKILYSYGCYKNGNYYGDPPVLHVFPQHTLDLSTYAAKGLMNVSFCFRNSYCGAINTPATYYWAFQMPKYNAATFFWNVVAAVGIVVAVTAITLAATIGFSKFAKRKRADNVAKASAAQSDYQAAVRGEEQYYDEESHTWKTRVFDTNSAEGQAKINQYYKAYKKTALSNNLWSNIIGGSKYDVSSFWGEKDIEGSSLSTVTESIKSNFDEAVGQYTGFSDPSIDSNTVIINLIKG